MSKKNKKDATGPGMNIQEATRGEVEENTVDASLPGADALATPEVADTPEVTEPDASEDSGGSDKSDVPAFRLGPPDKLLSEMTYEELLAEAQRYEHIERLLDEQNQEQVKLLAQERAQNEALTSQLAAMGLDPVAQDLGGAPDPIGLGLPRTQVPVFLKKMWARSTPDIEVGDCIGYVVLRDGVDLNLLVDAVRSQYASDTPPAGNS